MNPSSPVAFIVSISVFATIAVVSLNNILPCGTEWAMLAVLISFIIAVFSYLKTWGKTAMINKSQMTKSQRSMIALAATAFLFLVCAVHYVATTTLEGMLSDIAILIFCGILAVVYLAVVLGPSLLMNFWIERGRDD